MLALCVKVACMFTLGGRWKPCPLEKVGRFLTHRIFYLLSSTSVTLKERLAINLAASWIFFSVKRELLPNAPKNLNLNKQNL